MDSELDLFDELEDPPDRFDELLEEELVDEPQDPPDPPTGPPAEEYTREEGRPEQFLAFLDSEDGQLFWTDLERTALAALRAGEERFSPRTYLAAYRDRRKVRINNDFSPWFADELVRRHPPLLAIIERRARKKRGPERRT